MEKFKIEIKWSIILALVYFGWLLLERFLGYHNEKVLQELIFNLAFTPIAFYIYYLAIKNKKKQVFNDSINWKEGFVSGIILSVLVAVTSTFVLFLFFNFISPDFFEKAIELSKNKTTATLSYNLPIFVKNNIFDKLSFGIVFSAIISFFVKIK